MSQEEALRAAVEIAPRSWPEIPASGDPNTIDVYWHAKRVAEILNLRVAMDVPNKELGVSVVECVERNFAHNALMRQLPVHDLSQRASALVEAIQHQGLLSFGLECNYVVALYSWHGCINMATLLRRTHVVPGGGEEPYTPDTKHMQHAWLRDCSTQEEARGNPWVRYGVSSARLLEKNRKRDDFAKYVNEEWVPGDSPYWDP